MTRKFTKYIHVKVSDELYNKAKQLASVCCEGRISQLVRMLIEKEYEKIIGRKTGDKA